ncbi:BCCT family transporter [Aquimarina muelleri]|uniref:Glycine/betaine ABC transporter n=1 Tax=Aquimarina muelleri TaxID=279356 RepID=A0A918JVI8_9FLAO|nr:BCCT family transporter [Aquimarina muelleri]MCX2761177.1 BCCT family transporter [Aquimarina muelleri]GGX08845.1 glycine/betaine ABC transporter [Aquimarina muelleri]
MKFDIKKNSLLFISIAILLFFSFFLYFFTLESYDYIESFSIHIRQLFGRFYLWLGLSCVLLLILLAFSSWGKHRLGKASDKPQFSRLAWISMLYSAGMGAGILLRAIQEPVFMMHNPPIKNNISTKTIALEYTFYQWGFTAWAFYAVFAIAMGYYLFVKSKKVLSSSAFSSIEDLINSKRSKNIIFGSIDILAILTTVFGLVAAIGLGTTQIEGGLNHLFNENFGLKGTILILLIISLLAFTSVFRGVNKGIKIISTWNIYITIGLLIFVFLQNDVLSIITQFCTSLYHYIIDFIPLSLAYGEYNPGEAFLTDWTYYYWAFWLAWAPFTGIFIARISKGRTIREVIIGVLLVPSMGTFFWFTTFGQSAFEIIESFEVYQGQFDNVFSSIFVFFENYPFQGFINTLIILLLISFLVTSLDSAIFVLSMFTDNGKQEPSKKHRILWSIILTVFSIAIILLGNAKADINVLIAMQKLLIITSLPFSLLMVLMIILFFRDYKKNLHTSYSK